MKLPRPRVHARLALAARISKIAALGLALVGVVLTVLDQNWTAALFATATALWAASALVRRCPTPAPERGAVGLLFTGGPLDGADIPMPPFAGHDLQGARIDLAGTTYRVTTVHHTCYSAEAEATR